MSNKLKQLTALRNAIDALIEEEKKESLKNEVAASSLRKRQNKKDERVEAFAVRYATRKWRKPANLKTA